MSCGIKLSLDNIIRVGQKEEQEKAVTPTKEQQVVLPDTSKTLSKVIVKPIPDDYIIPSGELEINEQGVFNVKEYESINVKAPFDKLFNQYLNGTLTQVTAEDLQGATRINDYAFYNQAYLKSFDFNNIDIIGNMAFAKTQSLKNVFLKDSVIINGTPFAESKIQKFKGFGINTPNVAKGTFKNIHSLTHVEFYEGVLNVDILSNGTSLIAGMIIVPSTCVNYNGGRYANISNSVFKSLEPPSIPDNYNLSVIGKSFVPLVSINKYKTATNWVAGANKIYPFVQTESDLSTIDTTQYTKACVIGNDKGIEDDNNYKIYNYTNGKWVKGS